MATNLKLEPELCHWILAFKSALKTKLLHQFEMKFKNF